MVATQIPQQVYDDLRMSAIHEAGHVVLRADGGWIVEKVEIKPHTQLLRFPGKTTANGSANIPNIQADPDTHLAPPLGGYAATLVAFRAGTLTNFKNEVGLMAWSSEGTDGDEAMYDLVLKALGKPLLPTDQWARAKAFHDAADQIAVPRLLKRRDDVEAVADAIYETVAPEFQVGVPFGGREILADELFSKSFFYMK
jgi:hypothetical protein